MKKLLSKWNNSTEPQKITVMVAPLPLLALVASVALLNTYISFTSAVFIVVALLFIGSIATGVVVAVVKDEERIAVQRDASRRHNALQAKHRQLELSLECATLNENGLLNLVRLITCASVTATALDRKDYTSRDYQMMLQEMGDTLDQMVNFVILDGELTNDRLAWYAQAFHNGYCTSIDNMVELDRLNAKVEFITDGGDAVIDEPTFTHSASTAFMLGTLDRAYEVNGETVYPLA